MSKEIETHKADVKIDGEQLSGCFSWEFYVSVGSRPHAHIMRHSDSSHDDDRLNIGDRVYLTLIDDFERELSQNAVVKSMPLFEPTDAVPYRIITLDIIGE